MNIAANGHFCIIQWIIESCSDKFEEMQKERSEKKYDNIYGKMAEHAIINGHLDTCKKIFEIAPILDKNNLQELQKSAMDNLECYNSNDDRSDLIETNRKKNGFEIIKFIFNKTKELGYSLATVKEVYPDLYKNDEKKIIEILTWIIKEGSINKKEILTHILSAYKKKEFVELKEWLA